VRAPAPLDVSALVASRGPIEARRDLAARVLEHPRDVQARLALAALADRIGRPTEAIEQLEAVLRLGGPLGTRWHGEDKARLGRLLLARGRARLVRNAPTALADLERAASLGAAPSADELVSARTALATAQIRHVDREVRAKARATFTQLAQRGKTVAAANRAKVIGAAVGDAAATSSVSVGDAAATGATAIGVTVANAPPIAGPTVRPTSAAIDATDEQSWLGAAPTATPAERGVFGLWLWSVGAKRESYEQLVGWHGATRPPRDPILQAAYLRAFAWWTPLWLGEVPPPPAEDLVGPERCWFPGTRCAPPVSEPLPLPPVEDLGAAGGADAAAALARSPRAAAAIRYASTRFAGGIATAGLAPIAVAYLRDGAIADRLARDLVAASVDAAVASATLGALFDALGDASRARAAWQDAATQSPEPAFQRGLAEAIGRTGEGPAALVIGTQAAAAWGDPAVVWNGVTAALLDAKQYVDALGAARSALELAGPDDLPRSLDLAIEASRALGRTAQAEAMVLQRAQLAPRGRAVDADALAALADHRTNPTASTVATLWVVSRRYPRDIELRATLIGALDTDDPRRATLVTELIALAGDDDPSRAYAAATALH
jgi:tetratricopeptide (TPR) repeat protein